MQTTVNSITFGRWFKRSVFDDTCCLPEEKAKEIAKLFDHYLWLLHSNGY